MTDLPRAAAFEPPADDDPLSGLDLTDALGSVKRICTVEILGIVEPADLAAVVSNQPPPARTDPTSTAPNDIKRVREKHHSVARLVASGLTQRMVAQFSGYTEGYLSTLLDTPAMQELVAFYRGKYTSATEMMAERLRLVADTALSALQEKLEAEGVEMDAHALISAVKLGADRSGNGPSQHVLTESHVFDHAALQKKHQEVRQASAARTIQPAPRALPSPQDAGEEGLGDAGTE